MNNKKKELKPYMAYCSELLPDDNVSILIFHYTARKAKILAWLLAGDELVDGECMDLRVEYMKNKPWLMEEKEKNEPHAIWSPKHCRLCEGWGHSPIGKDGLCDDCRGEKNESI